MSVSKLQRQTLQEQAYRALRDMIASHRFSSGKWINLEQLSKELGVSRTPIQQAMKQLEAEGLVTHVPNQGIRMAEMTLEMARDLYRVREVLEALAAGLAAERVNRETLQEMEKILAEQRTVVRRKQLLEYSISDFHFHQALYESCGNWLLREQLEQIKGRSRPLICDITPILPQLFQDHHDLVTALKKGQPRRAEQVMRRHNRRMRTQIEKTRTDSPEPAPVKPEGRRPEARNQNRSKREL